MGRGVFLFLIYYVTDMLAIRYYLLIARKYFLFII